MVSLCIKLFSKGPFRDRTRLVRTNEHTDKIGSPPSVFRDTAIGLVILLDEKDIENLVAVYSRIGVMQILRLDYAG